MFISRRRKRERSLYNVRQHRRRARGCKPERRLALPGRPGNVHLCGGPDEQFTAGGDCTVLVIRHRTHTALRWTGGLCRLCIQRRANARRRLARRTGHARLAPPGSGGGIHLSGVPGVARSCQRNKRAFLSAPVVSPQSLRVGTAGVGTGHGDHTGAALRHMIGAGARVVGSHPSGSHDFPAGWACGL